jgi:2-polyprenyl-6-methoxyphenol hydroxylase-like FAD-dependent oxidoreductase
LEVVLFERDASPEAREQGYLIGLNAESTKAMAPLLATVPGLRELLHPPHGHQPSDFILLQGAGRDGSPLHHFATVYAGSSMALVNRGAFRRCLTQGVDVRWGKRITRYEESAAEGKVTVHFDDGTSERGDLLVAADGGNSAVRRQRYPSLLFQDTGYINTAGECPWAAASPELQAHMRRGAVRYFGDNGHSLLMFRFMSPSVSGNGELEERVLWSFSFAGKPADWAGFVRAGTETHEDDVDRADRERASAPLRQWLNDRATANLAPAVAAIVTSVIPSTIQGPRQMHSMDPGSMQAILDGPTTRVVLLGDAAHGTTTQRGLGANTAIADAADLAAALAAPDWALTLPAYERTLVKRGRGVVNASVQSTASIHATSFMGKVARRLIFGLIGAITWAMS